MMRRLFLAVVVGVLASAMVFASPGVASAQEDECGTLLECMQELVRIVSGEDGAALTASDMEAIEQEFVDTVMAHEEALQSEDAELTASFYAEDAVSLPPGFPASIGRETIQSDFEFLFDNYDIEREFELVAYEINGDTATRRGEWTQTLTPTDGSEAIVETGRCVLGWEKIDGEWKVAWEIWNLYDE